MLQVLLGLSDSELDSALGLTSTLHRRKLRLAIEEFRDASNVYVIPTNYSTNDMHSKVYCALYLFIYY